MTTERRGPGLVVHWIGPAGTYGGWLSETALSEEHVALLRALIGSLGSSIWVANPYDPATVRSGATRPDDTQTLSVDLEGGMDIVRARWSKGHRAAVAQSRRSGVVVRVASSEADWRGYFEAYQESLTRWGSATSSRYDWPFLSQLAAEPPDIVRLWVGTHEGEIVAGALCLYDPVHVCYWHGASRASAFALRPTNLILHEAIADACGSGRRWFDLGSSGGHAGVEAFKRGLVRRRWRARRPYRSARSSPAPSASGESADG